MGVVLPGWADELLDLIGVSWPNVDEDDYREMANAMREFADDIDEGASEAHNAIQGLVNSAGGSSAVDALNAHWGKINGTHLKGLADCGRLAATAMDGVAVLIEGAKIGALVQLGILAAEVIAAQAAAPFTLGLSEVGALGATQVTRVIVKRLFKEVCRQVAEQVISMALTPVEEALGAMVGDLVVQLGANALGVKDGIDLRHAAKAGKDGFDQGVKDAKGAAASAADNPMELLSADGRRGGGSSSGGSGGFSFDKDEHDRAVTSLASAGGTFRNKAGGKIGKARSHHGRTRGKDFIADAANTMLDKVIAGIEEGVKKTAKHLDDNMTRGIKQMAKNHHENDKGLADHFKGLGKGDKKDPKAPNGGGNSGLGGKKERGSGSKAREQLKKEHPNNNTRLDLTKKGCGDPVDVATGRVYLTETDIVLPSAAMPLAFRRKYESSCRVGRRVGSSWTSTVDQRLEIDEQGIVFVTEDGMLLSYPTPVPDQAVMPARGPRWPLTRIDQDSWCIHDPDGGCIYYFSEAPHSPDLALLDEITDRNGNHITFDYDQSGAPVAIRHSGGYHLKFTNDEQGCISAVRLVGGAADGSDVLVMSYGHDAAGNLTEVINANGATTRFEYDGQHRMTAWIDANDSRYEYTYDQHSRCISQGGSEGHLRWAYDYGRPDPRNGHRVTAATNSLGHTTRYRINDRLQVVAETDSLGNTTHTAFDEGDRVVSVTDPLGRLTRYMRDEHGRLTVVHLPDGLQAHATYNDLGLPVTVTGVDGSTFVQGYDDRGNRTSVTDPDGATVRYTHDDRGYLTAVTDALGNTTHIECNAAGLPVSVMDPLGAVSWFRRDAFGRVVSDIDPLGEATRFVWTAGGNLVARIAPDGAEDSWTYDGEDNCISHTDPVGGVTRFEYTHFDLLASQTGPDGVRHEFTHDTEFRLTKVSNSQGLAWHYAYDSVGRVISETDFDGRALTYAYDAAGQLACGTDALGQTVAYTHDALGRVVEKNADGRITTYQYDAAGRPVRALNPDAVLEYQYDRSGRVTAEAVNGRTMSYAYDVLGRRVSRTTPAGATSTWTYDEVGNPNSLTASGHALDFEYDAAGRETTRRLGETLTLTKSWDHAGRLVGQYLTGPGSRAVQHRTYTYRPDGNIVGIDDHLNGPRGYELDAAGRVTTVRARGWTEAYAYDRDGNQTEANWPAKHAGSEARGLRTYTGTQITGAGQVRYEHDALGRIILRQKTRLSRKPATWRYTWDAEDRLTGVVTPDGTIWRYLYDPLGRRIAKQRVADGGAVLEHVDFAWDGANLAEQTTRIPGSPSTITITWDHAGLSPIAQTERKCLAGAPQEEYDARFFAIITDLVGTPTELVDERGVIAWRTRTTLWGITTWSRTSTAYTPLRFPGQYFDAETELHYNVYRYYDPEIARYATPDPLGLSPAPNPSTYVVNPCVWSDPLGLAPKACKQDAYGWGGSVRYRRLDHLGRPTGVDACVRPEMLGKGTEAGKLWPPGWRGQGDLFNEARGHLLADRLGGAGKGRHAYHNLVTQTQNPTNSPHQRDQVEQKIFDAVKKGEIVQYSIKPIYEGTNPIPIRLEYVAFGNRGFSLTHRLDNPAAGVRTPG